MRARRKLDGFDLIFKVFPYIWLTMFIMILSFWGFMAVKVYKTVNTVNEKGIKAVVEQTWCGNQPDCKLP